MDNDVSEREKVDEVNHYIQQLVNFEYSVPQIWDIVLSSIRGTLNWKRKEGKRRYRSAVESLDSRLRKKLLDPTNWYRDGATSTEPNKDCLGKELQDRREKTCRGYRKLKIKRKGWQKDDTEKYFSSNILHTVH